MAVTLKMIFAFHSNWHCCHPDIKIFVNYTYPNEIESPELASIFTQSIYENQLTSIVAFEDQKLSLVPCQFMKSDAEMFVP